MTSTVFYSWQSDISETRNVIQAALEKAVRDLNRNVSLELRVDQDTSGVAGWPDVTQTILGKIEQCQVFVADITPINGPCSSFRLTPNPNVLVELGYALGTGLGRTRMVCVVNSAYLPDGDIQALPFDIRGSRPLQFSLPGRDARGIAEGQEDPVRNKVRADLSRALERALIDTIDEIEAIKVNRNLNLTPHLATEHLERFQVVIETKTIAPFQVDFAVTEPSGNLLSGYMTAPTRIAPQQAKPVRFPVQTLKPLTGNNDIYVLSGKVSHVPTDQNPVPQFHRFEVKYRAVGNKLLEIDRVPIPVH